jgi:hypothetical protein
MAKLNQRICGLFCGDTWPIVRTFTDVALIDLTLTQAIFVIKKKDKDPDSAAIVTNIVTTGAGPDGQITDAVPADGTIAMKFRVSQAKSILLKPGRAYTYAIKVQDSSGEKYTLERGVITGERQVIAA